MVEDAQIKLKKTLDKVKMLTQANIVEVRSFASPADKVKLVAMGCCFLLLDDKQVPGYLNKKGIDDYWDIAKKHVFAKPGDLFVTLTDEEKGYDKTSIDPKKIRAVKERCRKLPDLWNEKEMQKSSDANYCLFLWVEAMVTFYDVYESTVEDREVCYV